MNENEEKCWNKPWTTRQIIDNASSWSLAGDVALLHSFEKFADSMFMKTQEISTNLDRLLYNAEEVQTKLSMTQNEFHSLKNSQFVESRVYEDDETLSSIEKDKVGEKSPSEDEKDITTSDAIAEGLRIMEEYYNKVEVSLSDSDDEEDKSIILKPKDIYAHRPLAPVIGTDEWYKKWQIDQFSTDSESDNVSETYSDSDSEECLPKNMLKGSETSSEIDTLSHKSGSIPTTNSGFSTTVKKQEGVTSSSESSEGTGSLPVKIPISSQSFAEQLAARLGSVISEREDISQPEEEINKRPIQTKDTSYVGGLFPDEPPPLDETDDTSLPRTFDENKDDLFWGRQTKPTTDGSTLFEDENHERHSTTRDENIIENQPKTSQNVKGLFDSDDSSDESDIFASDTRKLNKPPFLQSHKISAPLFADTPPELDTEQNNFGSATEKKPVGGVSIFGSTNIFANQSITDVIESKRNQTNTRTDGVSAKLEKEPEQKKQLKSNINTTERNVSKHNLFDDDFKVDVKLSNPDRPRKKINLFDDEDSDSKSTEATNLFDTEHDRITETGTSKKLSLFDDSSEEESDYRPVTTGDKYIYRFEGSLLKPNSNNGEHNKSIVPRKVSFFDEDDLFSSSIITQTTKRSLFEDSNDSDDLFVGNKNMEKDDLKPVTDMNKISLFSDNEDDYDFDANKCCYSNSQPEPQERKDSSVSQKKPLTLFSDDENDDFLDTRKSTVESGIDSNSPDNEYKTGDANTKNIFEREVIGAEINNDKLTTKKEFLKAEAKKDGVTAENPTTKTETLSHSQTSSQRFTNTSETVSKSDMSDSNMPGQILSSTKEVKEQKPTISLFSSAPPSDDEDWDTKSDSVSDPDDYRPYSIDDNVSRSSMFDNEPSSLNPNASSGIVRDLNVTRLDSDDSSFYPIVNSTKRFSSSIFADQQSQDQLFVTGNTTYPSDMIADSSVFISNSTLGSSVGSMSVEKSLTIAQSMPESEKEQYSEANKSERKNNSRNTVADSGSKKDSASKLPSKRGSPLKLKQNLNINVNALLPGSVPPKLKRDSAKESSNRNSIDNNTEKKSLLSASPILIRTSSSEKEAHSERPVNFDEPLEEIEVLRCVTRDRARIPIKRKPSTRRGRKEAARKSGIDFGDDADTNVHESTTIESSGEQPCMKDATMESILKEISPDMDVKAPGTEISFSDETEPKNKTSYVKDTKIGLPSEQDVLANYKKGTSKKTKSLFDDEDNDDDFFGAVKKSSSFTLHTDTQPADMTGNIEKSRIDLFGDSTNITDQSSFKRTTNKSARASLFGSGDDSDDDLFGTKSEKSKRAEEKSKNAVVKKKTSLFDDSSSDDDLFSKKSKSSKADIASQVVDKVTKKSSNLKKLEKDEAREDPLSNLLE